MVPVNMNLLTEGWTVCIEVTPAGLADRRHREISCAGALVSHA